MFFKKSCDNDEFNVYDKENHHYDQNHGEKIMIDLMN